jgi:predicted TIM-barrel fold metal-dependent hydrolase
MRKTLFASGGSDWPIAELAAEYRRAWDALASAVASLSEARGAM